MKKFEVVIKQPVVRYYRYLDIEAEHAEDVTAMVEQLEIDLAGPPADEWEDVPLDDYELVYIREIP